MSINGNTLAKHLVMVSQVIAWCMVSIMLLRRGLNQVHAAAQPSPLYDKTSHEGTGAVTSDGNATDGMATATTTVVIGPDGTTKTFEDNGTPAVVAGVIMITIAIIMLIISPTIMLMKVMEKRKKRILDAELESPPKYEDVVESAPRYSSLFVFNTDGEMTLISENIHREKTDIQKPLV